MSAHDLYSDVPRGQVLESYYTYAEAQRAVDFLSDRGFPVQHVSIIGSDLKMVESVLGRLTRGRAALAGAGTGAWLGLLIGLLLSLFAPEDTNTLVILLSAVVYGTVFGAILGFVGHALSGGRRDFSSRSRIVSSRYEVICAWAEADRARQLLAELKPAG